MCNDHTSACGPSGTPPPFPPDMTRLRKIIHVDMDAFYASVEQRDDPSLRGKPVVVAWRGARSVVCAASYEARVFGVRSAMPAVRAERLCPDAIFVPPDFARYKAVSQQVRAIFLRHTDLVEPLSLDEAYLDVTEPKSGIELATDIARTIRAQIREETNLTASAGIAPNKFLAKIASDWRKPDGQFVIPPQRVDAFLQPLPVNRVPGVGKVMEGKLAARGIVTCGDLRQWALIDLEEAFGSFGRSLYNRARGIDERPVEPDQQVQSISSEDTFAEDLLLEDLMINLAPAAEAKGIVLGGVVRGEDKEVPRISGDEAALREVFANLLENAVKHNGKGVEITGEVRHATNQIIVTISDTGKGIPQELVSTMFGRGNRRYAPGQNRGTGMGLYLCQLLTELHGGTISVSSEEGSGTTFETTLPLRRFG